MKISIVSDLHIDAHDDFPMVAASTEVDLLLVAGDIADGPLAVQWVKRQLQQLGVPVCMVLGNHEYYHSDLLTTDQQLGAGLPVGLNLLQCRSFVVGDFQVLGCTLWTDFALYGDIPAAMGSAQPYMLDYHAITWGGRSLSPVDVSRLHYRHRAWLECELKRAHEAGRRAIVLSHHAPSPRSIPVRFSGSKLSPSFASDLTSLMHAAWAPELWVHGHTHAAVDYREGKTRVVCHPRGYPGELELQEAGVRAKQIQLDREGFQDEPAS